MHIEDKASKHFLPITNKACMHLKRIENVRALFEDFLFASSSYTTLCLHGCIIMILLNTDLPTHNFKCRSDSLFLFKWVDLGQKKPQCGPDLVLLVKTLAMQ